MKDVDYKKMYLKHYKNTPNFYFWGTFIVISLAAIIAGILYNNEYSWDQDFIGYIIILGGILVGWGLAALNRFFAAVAISQKVVVADALLSMGDGTESSTVVDDELPEL